MYLGGVFLEEIAELYEVNLNTWGFAGAVNTGLLKKLGSTLSRKTKLEKRKKIKRKKKTLGSSDTPVWKNFHHHNSNQMDPPTLKQKQIQTPKPKQNQMKATESPHQEPTLLPSPAPLAFHQLHWLLLPASSVHSTKITVYLFWLKQLSDSAGLLRFPPFWIGNLFAGLCLTILTPLMHPSPLFHFSISSPCFPSLNGSILSTFISLGLFSS